jgi:AcrR family transcriptional regulator
MMAPCPDSDPGPAPGALLPLAADHLPLAGERAERCDAVLNRRRILCAARRLFAERGAAGVSMDAVAAAAGVGKGTVFRRFGDRSGLTAALLDEEMRDFQDAFLRGPAPLGPGAPPAQRLDAFVTELVALLDRHLELALAAEDGPPGGPGMRPTDSLALHLRVLLAELDPTLNAEVTAELILGAIGAGVISRLRRDRDIDLAALQAGARALVRGLAPEPTLAGA